MAKAANRQASPVARLANDLHFVRGQMLVLALLKDDPTSKTEPISDPDWWDLKRSELFARLVAARQRAQGIRQFLASSFKHPGWVETKVRVLFDDLLIVWLPMLTPGPFDTEASTRWGTLHRRVKKWATQLSGATAVETSDASATNGQRGGRSGRKHKEDAGTKLKATAQREFVLRWVKDHDWVGTLEELRVALKSDTRLTVSRSTLSRYLRGTRFTRRPHRAAKGRNEREGVADDSPADMSKLDTYTMPDRVS